MQIKIDHREAELIRCCKYILEISPSYKDIELVIENLPIGDIILSQNKFEKVIIERKSLADLSASIKDGRYEEQSYRLNGPDFHNHNIIYLVEGDLNRVNLFKDRIDKTMLYSAMISLNYLKGFSVMRSMNIDETAVIICNMAYKIAKTEKEGKHAYYMNAKKQDPEQQEEKEEKQKEEEEKEKQADNYCNVVKKVKKENVTPENIGEIMLSQIPGISSVTAIELMSQFKSLPNLIINIKENKHCLENLTYTNSKGQIRKINKSALANILKYFST